MSNLGPNTPPWTPSDSSTPPSAPSAPPSGSPSGMPSYPPSGPRGGNSASNQIKSMIGGMLPRLIAGGLTLAVAYGAYWFFVVHKDAQAVAQELPSIGSCFSWKDDPTGTGGSDTGATVLPCSDPAATYKSVATVTYKVTDGTAASDKACKDAGSYQDFSITSDPAHDGNEGTICGVLNLKVGDCVDDGAEAAVVACAAGKDEVTSIQTVATPEDAVSDKSANRVCAKSDTTYLSDTSAPAIVCLGKS